MCCIMCPPRYYEYASLTPVIESFGVGRERLHAICDVNKAEQKFSA